MELVTKQYNENNQYIPTLATQSNYERNQAITAAVNATMATTKWDAGASDQINTFFRTVANNPIIDAGMYNPVNTELEAWKKKIPNWCPICNAGWTEMHSKIHLAEFFRTATPQQVVFRELAVGPMTNAYFLRHLKVMGQRDAMHAGLLEYLRNAHNETFSKLNANDF